MKQIGTFTSTKEELENLNFQNMSYVNKKSVKIDK